MNIAIVFGGKSVEHDVSIITAKQIFSFIKDVHSIKLIYVDKNDNLNLYTNTNFDLSDFKKDSRCFTPIILYQSCLLTKGIFGYKASEKIDCAIMCTHGGNGENGALCSHFLLNKIPVTAGNQLALGISMNKWLTKQYLLSAGLPCVRGIYANKQSDIEKVNDQIESSFGYPVIVKANGGGSSIGIKSASNKTELAEALAVAFEFDSSAVIEELLVDFKEYNCAALGGQNAIEISNIDEPIRKDEILSFKDKYLGGAISKKSSQKFTKKQYAVLDKKTESKIKQLTKKVFLGLGFYGVIRVDFICCNKKIFINEINAIPGSLGYYYFSSSVTSAKIFIDKLINVAIKEYQNNAKINKNYITKLF